MNKEIKTVRQKQTFNRRKTKMIKRENEKALVKSGRDRVHLQPDRIPIA